MGKGSVGLARIFRQIRTKRVMLPMATHRARLSVAVGEDDEIAVSIRAIPKGQVIEWGPMPDWFGKPNEVKALTGQEHDQAKGQAEAWLRKVFAAGLADPVFTPGEPDPDKGEIGLEDLIDDAEILILEILGWSGFLIPRDHPERNGQKA